MSVNLDACFCAMCTLREAGGMENPMREYSPDQPRERGRFSKGGGGKAVGAAPGGKKMAGGSGGRTAPGISKDQGRVTPRKAGIPTNIGRAIFARAGKAVGYKEKRK
jgi:hypothetical protein